MTRVLTQMALVCMLASSLGAAPGQKTSGSRANTTPQSKPATEAGAAKPIAHAVKTPTTNSAKTSANPTNPAAAKLVRTSAQVRPQGATAAPKKLEPKPYQVGNASWYGGLFQGKPTASGETYDMYRFTAAHLQLPLGTWVRVTNLRNDRTVIVRINDRGPVTPGRIIDLSYSAAKQLDFSARGLAKVRIDVIPSPEGEHMTEKPAMLEAGVR